MWNSKIHFIFLVVSVAVAYCTDSRGSTHRSTVISTEYEEACSYADNPDCRPSLLDTGIPCRDVGPGIEFKGGLPFVFFAPLTSAYFAARFADAWGYQDRCLTNITFLRTLDFKGMWTGAEDAIAIDAACGYKDLIIEKCTFPSGGYPFLCTGGPGTPGTFGRRLETVSYITLLQDPNLTWTLFANCWRAKTKENPKSVEIATSFNVYSSVSKFSAADRKLIIQELTKRGFNTKKDNLIEFNYSITDCS